MAGELRMSCNFYGPKATIAWRDARRTTERRWSSTILTLIDAGMGLRLQAARHDDVSHITAASPGEYHASTNAVGEE
jgi:hypothetical protein